MKTRIRHIVVVGDYVFGAGKSKTGAIADAACWLADEDGKQGGLSAYTIKKRLNDINFPDYLLFSEGEEKFDQYMENSHFAEKKDGIYFVD